MSDTSTPANLGPDGDYIAVRVIAGAKSVIISYDRECRLRRMIRRINALGKEH